jgi:hypothetical protein
MRTISFLFGLTLLLFACKNRNSTEKNLTPAETFRDVLVEIHTVDGLYSQFFGFYVHHTDTLNSYNDIFKKYGYTKMQFDSTFKYYTRHAPELDKIYEDVITDLNKTQQDLFQLQTFETDTNKNLYKGKRSWHLPLHGRYNKIPFSIPLRKKDTVMYSILAQIRFMDYDATNAPHLTAYFWADNGTKEGKRDYFRKVEYRKSKRFVIYQSNHKPNDSTYTHLKGYIVDTDDDKDFRHLDVKRFIIFR